MVTRSQLSRVEALENHVEARQRAPLGTLWLRAADYATDEEEQAIRAVCCEALREHGYQPMVIVLVSPALDGGATAPRPQWSNPDPYVVTPWCTFGSERAADTLTIVASDSEKHVLAEAQQHEKPPAVTPVVTISFVAPEPELETEPAKFVVTPTAAPRRWNPELLLERSSGGPSSWMR